MSAKVKKQTEPVEPQPGENILDMVFFGKRLGEYYGHELPALAERCHREAKKHQRNVAMIKRLQATRSLQEDSTNS